MINKKKEYKNFIWKYGWVSGDKRWLFHIHGAGVELDGKVQMQDGNTVDWDITDNQLTIGERIYTIISLKTNGNGTFVIKDDKGNEETFISL